MYTSVADEEVEEDNVHVQLRYMSWYIEGYRENDDRYLW